MSNNAFAAYTTEGMERQKDEDTLGHSKSNVLPSDIYKLHVKYAYQGESAKGAISITVVGTINGDAYSETFWVVGKNKKNYSEKNDKKIPLPGFTIIDDMCLFATGKPLAQQTTSDKIIEKYDYASQSTQKVSVPVIDGLIDKDVLVAISQVKEYKSKKFDDGYHTIDKIFEHNEIEKVFHLDKHLTVNEIINKVEEPAFYDKWIEAKKGKVKDKTKGKQPERVESDSTTSTEADSAPVANPFA